MRLPSRVEWWRTAFSSEQENRMSGTSPANPNNPDNQQTGTNPLEVLAESFRNPNARPLHRVVVLGSIGLVFSAVWAYAATSTADPDDLRLGVLIGGGFLLGFWAVMTLALARGMGYGTRLAFTGGIPVGAWTVITAGFGFGETTSPLAVGLAAIWIIDVMLLVTPSWLVVFGPGEVYEYRPVTGLLRFVSSPLDEYGNPVLAYQWIAPLDSISLFWRIDERIALNARYDNITTIEGYQFSLEVRLMAEFDPAQIKAQMFELKLTYMQSYHDIREMLRATLEGVVELTARDFFIDMPHKDALAAGTVTTFKHALPEMAGPKLNPIGLRILAGTVTCIPHGSQETRRAADRAAAAPYETVANLAVQKELLRQALDGSVPAQLVLYAQMAAKGRPLQSGYAAPINRLKTPENFLQAVNQHDNAEARRLFADVFGEAEDARFNEVSGAESGDSGRRRSFDLGQLDGQ